MAKMRFMIFSSMKPRKGQPGLASLVFCVPVYGIYDFEILVLCFLSTVGDLGLKVNSNG